jgi:microcystin-dependent protein
MTQPFLGQIQPLAFNFAPRGWAQCNGQIMNISQSTALFSLLGTMYGGNGTTTFALPNLQSRVPMHVGTFQGENFFQGEVGGQETVTLNINTMPAHAHNFIGSSAGAGSALPEPGAALGKVGGSAGDSFYAADGTPQPITPNSIRANGGNQPHNNLQPYLTINWCIALSGIFPSRN